MQRLPKNVAVDTGVLVALAVAGDPDHTSCMETLKALPEVTSFVTTEACLTEVSWLLPNDRRLRDHIASLAEVLGIQIVCLDLPGLKRIYELMNRYDDLPMDFADATIVVACERLDVRHVFTLDRKDFSIYRPRHTKLFQLLPEE